MDRTGIAVDQRVEPAVNIHMGFTAAPGAGGEDASIGTGKALHGAVFELAPEIDLFRPLPEFLRCVVRDDSFDIFFTGEDIFREKIDGR